MSAHVGGVADPGLLARAQGCLLGQLAGDSLGRLVEFQSVATIRARYPDGCRDLSEGGTRGNLAGPACRSAGCRRC